MKNTNDILMMNNIIKDLSHTGVKDRPSNRKTFFTKTLPKLVEENQYKIFDENDLEGQGFLKVIIPSNRIDVYTRLEVLLSLKLSGRSNTLAKTSNSIDELY